jgi:excisionase family DNA binding protein
MEEDSATRMLTVREVCELLNVHSNTLRRQRRQGIVRSYRATAKGQRGFRPEDAAALL